MSTIPFSRGLLGLGFFLIFFQLNRAESGPMYNLAKDAQGDLLPEGARGRLGTVRFRHGLFIHALAYSPDGTMLASAGSDALRVWDAATGKEFYSWPGPTQKDNVFHGFLSVTFSPDGKILAAGTAHGSIIFGDPVTGKKLREWSAHKGQIRRLNFSQDSKILASTGREGILCTWDVANGANLLTVGNGQWNSTNSGVLGGISADGQTVLLAHDNPFTVQAFSVGNGKRVFEVLANQFKVLTTAALAPDHRTIVVGELGDMVGSKSSLRFWDLTSGQEQVSLRINLDYGAFALAFSPDGKTLAIAGPAIAKKVLLYDWRTAREIGSVPAITGGVNCLAFTPDGKGLALAGWHGNAIRFMNIAANKEVVPCEGHLAGVYGFAVAPDGKTLYSAGDNTVRAWNLSTGQERLRFPGHEFQAASLALSPDGKTLASGGGPHYLDPAVHSVVLWNTQSGKEIQRIPNRQMMQTLAFAPDGQSLALGGYRGTIRLWNIGTGKEIRQAVSRTPEYVAQVLFSPNGKYLASVTNQTLVLWDVGTGGKYWSRKAGVYLRNACAFSPDGQHLVIYDRGSSIYLLNTNLGNEVLKIPTNDPWGGVVAISPDGRTLAFGGGRYDLRIHLWDLALNKECHVLAGHRGGITGLAFIGDHLLVSASGDTTILLWDLTIPPIKKETSPVP